MDLMIGGWMSFVAVDLVEIVLVTEGSLLNDPMFPMSAYSLSVLFLTALGILIAATQAAKLHLSLKKMIMSLPSHYENLFFCFGTFFLLIKIAIYFGPVA